MSDTLTDQLATLATLMHEAHALSAPFDRQIKALETAKADALAALAFQIDTLKAALRPLLLAQGETLRHHGLTIGYVHKQVWDNDALEAFAAEVPAVLQCRRDGSYVTFRLRQTTQTKEG